MAVWIFQGNPEHYELNRYLKEKNPIFWSVRQAYYEKEIDISDKVYIWRAKGKGTETAGIVAVGKIISKPDYLENKELEEDKKYWLQENRKNSIIKRVKIELELPVRLTPSEGMISREELLLHPKLKNLKIIRFPQQTNYKLSPEEAELLNEIWMKKSRAYLKIEE